MSAPDLMSWICRGVAVLILLGGAVLVPVGLWALVKLLLNTKQP